MTRYDFEPPCYEETLHVYFDKSTGKVLATEKRCVLVGDEVESKTSKNIDLLKRVAFHSGKSSEEIDVFILSNELEINRVIKRIDLNQRRPIFEEALNPFKLISP